VKIFRHYYLMCLMYVLKRFELNQHDCFDIFCALSLVTDSYKYSFLKTVVDWNTLLDCTVLLFFSLFLYSGPWFCLQSGSNGLMADNRQKNCLGILYFYIAFSSMQFLNLYMAFLGFFAASLHLVYFTQQASSLKYYLVRYFAAFTASYLCPSRSSTPLGGSTPLDHSWTRIHEFHV